MSSAEKDENGQRHSSTRAVHLPALLSLFYSHLLSHRCSSLAGTWRRARLGRPLEARGEINSLGEGSESRDEHGHDRPGVPEAEWEVYKERIVHVLSREMCRETVITSADDGCDQEGEDEGDQVMLGDPDVEEDRVEDTETCERPADSVDGVVARIHELEKDESQEQNVDNGPVINSCVSFLPISSPIPFPFRSFRATLEPSAAERLPLPPFLPAPVQRAQ